MPLTPTIPRKHAVLTAEVSAVPSRRSPLPARQEDILAAARERFEHAHLSTLSLQHELRDWTQFAVQISETRVIGQPSCNGIALLVTLSDQSRVICKLPRNSEHVDSLRHEAIVGMVGLNRLRCRLPNFSLVLSYFKAPIYKEQWSKESQQQVGMVIYEEVANAIDFGEKLNKLDTVELFGLLLQVVAALFTANQVCNFTHYDLHSGNILLTPHRAKFPLIYAAPNDGEITLKAANYVANFIDYGSSLITEQNKTFGPTGWSAAHNNSYNVDSESSNPLHDVLKLLGSLFHRVAPRSNNELLLFELIQWFIQVETIEELRSSMGRHDYFWPRASTLIDLKEFYSYLLLVQSYNQWNV